MIRKTALLSLQALLCAPEPNDPQDAVVAEVYKTNHKKFLETAIFWTETYAKPDHNKKKVDALVEMGFDAAKATKALEESDWDETVALEKLLG